MRKIVILVATSAALLITGCNTVAGMGRDVQAAGEAVEQTADDIRN